MKKRLIISGIVLIVACVLGIGIFLYNTPDIRIGMAHSDDGLVNYPMITCRSYLGSLGLSKKANEKWSKISGDYSKEYSSFLTGYKKDLQLDADITYDKDKTIIHFYGSGTPIDGESIEKIDKIYTINQKLKPEQQ